MAVSDDFLVKTTVMAYYEIPPEVLENPEELAQWAQRSFEVRAGKRPSLRRGD